MPSRELEYQQSQQVQQVQQVQQQQVLVRPGGGGGGGGDRPIGGPGSFGPEELAGIFRQLGRASGAFFAEKPECLLDEGAVRELIVVTMDALAEGALKGTLPDIANHLEHEAANARGEINERLSQQSGAQRQMRVMDGQAASLISQRIKDRWIPPPLK